MLQKCIDFARKINEIHEICPSDMDVAHPTPGAPPSQSNVADKGFWHVAIYIYIYIYVYIYI